MNFELKKTLEFKIEDIVKIGSYTSKLNVNDSLLTLEISLSYFDKNDHEIFKTLTSNIDLELIDIILEKIEIKDLKAFVIEGYGITVDCIFTVDTIDKKEDKEDIHDAVLEADDIHEEEKKDDIKKIIKNEYENMLLENVQERTIITTKNGNENDFLSFFDNNLTNYYSLKCLSVKNEEELNEIAKEYNVPFIDLLKGYDKEHGRVLFKYNKKDSIKGQNR